jgi:hypothetical protein
MQIRYAETIELDPFDQRSSPSCAATIWNRRARLPRRWACRKVRCCGGCGGCAKGVIVGDVALIDPARLAPSITIHVLIETSHSGLKQEQALAARLRQRLEVIGAWNVTGRTDFVLMVAVPRSRPISAFPMKCWPLTRTSRVSKHW